MIERPSMTPEQLRAAMLMLGQGGKPIEQGEMCGMVWCTPRQLRRYLSGENFIHPLLADRVGRLLDEHAKPKRKLAGAAAVAHNANHANRGLDRVRAGPVGR